jgi:hypothetical protein
MRVRKTFFIWIITLLLIAFSGTLTSCKRYKTVEVTRARKKTIFYDPMKKRTNKPPKRVKKIKMRAK